MPFSRLLPSNPSREKGSNLDIGNGGSSEILGEEPSFYSSYARDRYFDQQQALKGRDGKRAVTASADRRRGGRARIGPRARTAPVKEEYSGTLSGWAPEEEAQQRS